MICIITFSLFNKIPISIKENPIVKMMKKIQLNSLGRLFCSRYTLSFTSTTIASFNLSISKDLGLSFTILSNGVSTPNSFVIFLKIFIFPSFRVRFR